MSPEASTVAGIQLPWAAGVPSAGVWHAWTAGTQAQAAFPPVCASLPPIALHNKAEGLGWKSIETRNCESCPLSLSRACFAPEPAGDNVVKASLQAGQLTDLCLFSLRLEGENLQAGKGSEALIPRAPLGERLDPGPPCPVCFLFLNGDTEPQDVQAWRDVMGWDKTVILEVACMLWSLDAVWGPRPSV